MSGVRFWSFELAQAFQNRKKTLLPSFFTNILATLWKNRNKSTYTSRNEHLMRSENTSGPSFSQRPAMRSYCGNCAASSSSVEASFSKKDIKLLASWGHVSYFLNI